MQTDLLPVHTIPVPEAQRLAFLPRHWPRLYMQVESSNFNCARIMLPEYSGGFWHYVEVSNGAGFMWPDIKAEHQGGNVRVHGPENGYTGLLSPEAAGIVCMLMVLSHLSFKYQDDVSLVEQFHLLREFVDSHPEGADIFRAID